MCLSYMQGHNISNVQLAEILICVDDVPCHSIILGRNVSLLDLLLYLCVSLLL